MISNKKSFIPLGLVLVVFGFVNPLTIGNQPALAATTFSLEQPVYFLSPDDEPFIVEPGTYQVEAAEVWLKLIPEKGPRTEAMLMDATSGTHDDEVSTPTVVMVPIEDNSDLRHLVLLLPDGRELSTVGSTTGIWPRAAWKFQRSTVPGGGKVQNIVTRGYFTKPSKGAIVKGTVHLNVFASSPVGVSSVPILRW